MTDPPDAPAAAPVSPSLAPADLARLARLLEPALATHPATQLALHPSTPGTPVLVDQHGLWELLRRDDLPWTATDPAARARFLLAVLVTLGGADRLKTCATPGCRRIFADTSNNQSRRRCPQHVRHKTRTK